MSERPIADGTPRASARRLGELHRASLAIAGDLDLDSVLLKILRTARRLVRARYGALGVPDGKGGFDKFITVGFSDRRARQIGELPRFHGVLGILLSEGRAIRMKDIRRHPHFSWYPVHHPEMKEFLGVPIKHRDQVLGEMFFSGTPTSAFSAADQQVVEMLASHAGIAIATAHLYAQSQALAVLEERNRVARELHDSVSQTLFSMMYEARAAALAAPEKPELAEEALQQIERQAGSALAEMRGLVYALRPKSLERDGLAVTLRDHAESLRRAHGIDINIRIEGVSPLPLEQETAIFRIAQEALQNAIKHGAGAPVAVTLRQGRLGTELFVEDAGPGFDLTNPKRTVRTMGLSTMRDRAAAIGADLELSSRPGDRTAVHVFLPARSSRH